MKRVLESWELTVFHAWVLYFHKWGDREPEGKGLAQGHSESQWKWWGMNLGHLVPKLVFCISISIGQIVLP